MRQAEVVRAPERWSRSTTVCIVLAVAATASTFTPWAKTGTRPRSSYGLVDIAERAGVLPPTVAELSIVWFFVPALCGVVLLGAAARRVRVLATTTASLGALVAVGGVLVARSPLVTEPGAVIGALAGGSAAVAGAITLAVTIERARRHD